MYTRPLAKVRFGWDAIAECGNQVDPKVKAAPSVPIGFFEDAEDLEPTNDMLDWQPDLCELPIADSLLVGERVVLAGLLRRPRERMLVLNALIAGIGDEFGLRVNGRLRLPQELKVMRRPTTRGDTEDLW